MELVGRHYAEEIGFAIRRLWITSRSFWPSFVMSSNCTRSAMAGDVHSPTWARCCIESEPCFGPAPSFDRERQVRKHIGDYTLFFTGMFPESINQFRLRRNRLENFVDWIKAGKESYYIVSKFDVFEYTKVAPLFASLSSHFEQCVFGLNRVKNELQEMQHPIVRQANEIVM